VRFWWRTDPHRVLAFYRRAQRDFRLYRLLLLACNTTYAMSAQYASKAALRAALDDRNRAAVAQLANLADSVEEQRRVLEKSIPACTAFGALDRAFECARDCILAVADDGTELVATAQQQILDWLTNGRVTDLLAKQIEIANLVLAKRDSGYNEFGPAFIEKFQPNPWSEPPELLLLGWSMGGSMGWY
jgi:hypothetical protein